MKQAAVFILFLLAFVATASGSVVVETRPNASATFIRSIPVQDTTGNIGSGYGLRFNATMDTLVWFDISTSGSVDSIFVQYGTSAWSASGWYKNGDTLTIDTSDAGAGDNILIDSGAAVIDPSTIVLQEGTNISFVFGNDTLVISASVDSVTKALQDASGNVITTTYLTSATAASTYETITNVGLIGDDTATWNAVAAAFDTTYDQLTVGGQVLSGDASILSEAELTDSLTARGFLTSLSLVWYTASNKDTIALVGTADTVLKITRDPNNDTTKLIVPSGVLVIQGGSNGIPAMDSLLLTNSGYIRLADLVLDSALFDSIVNASGRFAIGAGSGSDSVKIDSGGAVVDMTGAVVFQEGANVDITVNGDTVIIASTGGGSSGADSILVDTAGTGTNMGDAGGGFVIREGTNVTLTMVGDTMVITASATGSAVWDVNGDTTQWTDADNDTNLKIYDGDNEITTISSGSNDTLILTAPDLVQIGSNAGRVWADSLDINFYLSIGTGSNQMDSALFDSIVNGTGRFSVVSGGLWDTTSTDSTVQYTDAANDTVISFTQTSAEKTTIGSSNDTISIDAVLSTTTEGVTQVDSLKALGTIAVGTGSQRIDSALVDSMVNALGRFSASGGAGDDIRADTGSAIVDMSTAVLQAGSNITLDVVNGDTLVITSTGGTTIEVDSAGNATNVASLTNLILQKGSNVTLTVDGDTVTIASTGGGIFDVSGDTAQFVDADNDTILRMYDLDDDTTRLDAGPNTLIVGAEGTTYSDSLLLFGWLNIGSAGTMDSALFDSIINATGRFSVSGGSGDNVKADTGAAVVDMTEMVLQEGTNVDLAVVNGDTLVITVDLSSYLTSATAASTYETITNVGLIGDDTATWNTVAAAFDTNYTSITVAGQVLNNDDSIVNIPELMTVLADYLLEADFADTLANYLKVDSGAAVVGFDNFVLQEGSNITLTINGDTVIVAADLSSYLTSATAASTYETISNVALIGDDTANFKTAFGWGDHSAQNYLDNDDPNVDTAAWNAAAAGGGDNVKVDTVGGGAGIIDPSGIVLTVGTGISVSVDGDTVVINSTVDSVGKALADASGNTITSTYATITSVGLIGDDTTTWNAVAAAFDTNYSSITIASQVIDHDDSIVNIPELTTILADYVLEADFPDTLANYLKVDSGAAVVGFDNFVLQEGSNVTLTIDGDTVIVAANLSSYLTSATAASTYETIANVALIGDDTANFKTAFGWGDHASAGYLTAQLWDTINAATLVYVDADTALKITNGTENVTITAGDNDTLTLGADGLTLTDSLFIFGYLNIGNAPVLDSALIDSIINQTGRFASGLGAAAFGDTLANHLKVDSGAAVVDMSSLVLQEGSNVALVIDGDTVAITVDLSSYLTSATAASTYETITNVGLIGDDTATWNAVAAVFDTNYAQATIADLQMSGEIDMNSNKITEIANPTSDQDAATKYYADSVAQNAQWDNVTIVGDLNVYGGNVNIINQMTELDINYSYAEYPDTFLSIPYYRDNGGLFNPTDPMLHPSILTFPAPYYGYKYWLGYTPYNTVIDENPCIAVSNNLDSGFQHYVPSGTTDTVGAIVTRALTGVTGGSGHNADADLGITREGYLAASFLIVEDVDGTDSSYIGITFSGDGGVTWTKFSDVGSVTSDTTYDTLIASYDVYPSNPSGIMVSQSFLVDTGGTYSMWMTIADSVDVQSYFVKYQSDSAHTGWSLVDTCVYNTTADSLKPWHGSVFNISADVLGLLMSEAYDSTAGSYSNLTLSVSYDRGLTWEHTTKLFSGKLREPFYNVDSSEFGALAIYRSDAFVISTVDGIKLGLVVSGRDNVTGSGWHIGYTEIIFDIPEEKEATIYAPDGINSAIPIFFADSINYPYGVSLVDASIQLPADAAYSLPVVKYSGDPPAASTGDTLATLTTTSSDNYNRITKDSFDEVRLDAGDHLFLDLPATAVDWVKVKVRYHKRLNPRRF